MQAKGKDGEGKEIHLPSEELIFFLNRVASQDSRERESGTALQQRHPEGESSRKREKENNGGDQRERAGAVASRGRELRRPEGEQRTRERTGEERWR